MGLQIKDIIERMRKRQDEIRSRKLRLSNPVPKISTARVRALYFALMDKHFRGTKIVWRGKEGKLTKTLVEEMGVEDTLKFIEYVITNWSWLSTKYRIRTPAPVIGAIFAYRQVFLSEVADDPGSKPTGDFGAPKKTYKDETF